MNRTLYRRQIYAAAVACAALFFAAPLSAERHFIGIGFGLQYDLGQLGNTIVVDGLDSTKGQPGSVGRTNVTGCGFDINSACFQENGPPQKLIVPENQLIALEKNTAGAVRSNTSGPMIGGVLELFYEREFEATFLRGGLQYTKRILGGSSQSHLFKGSPFELKWYDIRWDFYSFTAPFYFGYKARIGKSAAVYAGAGLNYSIGGWNVGGDNLGDLPSSLLGGLVGVRGAVTTTSAVTPGRVITTGVYQESIKFRVQGIGYNTLIGLETSLESGDRLFFEIEQIFAGDQGRSVVQSFGGAGGFAPIAAYPIDLGGRKFKFGYKFSL